jgi:hypothetical protein
MDLSRVPAEPADHTHLFSPRFLSPTSSPSIRLSDMTSSSLQLEAFVVGWPHGSQAVDSLVTLSIELVQLLQGLHAINKTDQGQLEELWKHLRNFHRVLSLHDPSSEYGQGTSSYGILHIPCTTGTPSKSSDQGQLEELWRHFLNH